MKTAFSSIFVFCTNNLKCKNRIIKNGIIKNLLIIQQNDACSNSSDINITSIYISIL